MSRRTTPGPGGLAWAREQENTPGRTLAPFRKQPPEYRRVLIIERRRCMLIADEQRSEPGAVCRRRALDQPASAVARFHSGVVGRQRDPNPHRPLLVAN